MKRFIGRVIAFISDRYSRIGMVVITLPLSWVGKGRFQP